MGGFLSPASQAMFPPSHALIVKQHLQIVYNKNKNKKNKYFSDALAVAFNTLSVPKHTTARVYRFAELSLRVLFLPVQHGNDFTSSTVPHPKTSFSPVKKAVVERCQVRTTVFTRPDLHGVRLPDERYRDWQCRVGDKQS